MAKLPDKIYIIDPYDEDGDLVDNTEDVLWCQDAVGDENVEYISSQSVADALPSTWYADAPNWQGRLDSTIANLGLESTEHAADCPCAWCRVRRDNAEIGKRS